MPTTKVRVKWPDVAKGISILGVVLFHSVLFSATGDTAMGRFSDLLTPLRMGLFFLTSGIFAIKVRRISFGTVFRTRLWTWMIPYVAWTIIAWYVQYYFGNRESLAPTVWSSIAYPIAGLWFLYALSMFTVIVWLTRKWPLPYVLVLSVAISLAVKYCELPWVFARSFLFFPFFILGMMLRQQWIKAENFTVLKGNGSSQLDFTKVAFTVLAVVGYVAAIKLEKFDLTTLGRDFNHWWPLVFQVSDTLSYLLALMFGVLISVALAKIPKVGDALMWYGRHTLPIYLINESAAWVMVTTFRELFNDGIFESYWVRSLFSLGIFLATLAVCHLAVWLSTRKMTRWIFYPPAIEEIGGVFIKGNKSNNGGRRKLVTKSQ